MNQKNKPPVSYVYLVMPSNFHEPDAPDNDDQKKESQNKSSKAKKKPKDPTESNNDKSKHKRNDAIMDFDLTILGEKPTKKKDVAMLGIESSSASAMSIDKNDSDSKSVSMMSIS